MLIVAFETSCDDTACALVRNGWQVLAQAQAGQAAVHAPYGGVIPELAARSHQHTLTQLLKTCLAEANLPLSAVDAFAATVGPGLIGSLLVGTMAAKTLAWYYGKPFIGVHHLWGHVASASLPAEPNAVEAAPVAPPFLCLLASGGHTQWLNVTHEGPPQLLGQSLDDAAGEVFDKVARLLGLPFPGGPAMDALAVAYGPTAPLLPLPVAQTADPLAMSFSGLKTAALRLIQQRYPTGLPAEADLTPDDQRWRQQVAASVQAAVVNALLQRAKRALALTGQRCLVVVGGVSANTGLRSAFEALCQAEGVTLVCPPLRYCSDNAAMIGASAALTPYSYGLLAPVFARDSLPAAAKV
jgi:N6-L-threonylcarbamoyladenine synthase